MLNNKTDIILPIDILNDRKKTIVKDYIYNKKTFTIIGKELNINKTQVKYEFYSALTTMSRTAAFRNLLAVHKASIRPKQVKVVEEVYIHGKSLTEVALRTGKSKQAISQLLNRLVKRYNLKWKVFVKKKEGRLIYNTEKVVKW